MIKKPKYSIGEQVIVEDVDNEEVYDLYLTIIKSAEYSHGTGWYYYFEKPVSFDKLVQWGGLEKFIHKL